MRPFAIVIALLGALSSALAVAQEQEDARRLLEQRLDRQALEQEHELLKDEVDRERPTITVDGRIYTVEHNASDVGRALYLSLQQRQWPAAAHFLDEYLTIPGRDPMLVHHAQGVLARVQGRYHDAEREFRAVLELQADFLVGRLELARVLFEDQQDREAAELFASIADSIDTSDPKTAGVRRTVGTFRQALAGRRNWGGTFAVGPAWSDNVNRTSASRTCLWADDAGNCFIERNLPDAIVATGYDYDASLGKRLPLRGNHGFYLRSLLFGQSYRDHGDYNELTSTTQLGYSYRSGRLNFALAPSFDFYALGNSALYGASGVHGEWGYLLSSRSMLKLEADWKELRYRRQDYAAAYNGPSRSVDLTYFRGIGPRWTLFGGLDVMKSDTPLEVSSYVQKGLRVGALLQWPDGFTGTLFASYRRRQYQAYSGLLQAQRRDDEQNYTVVLSAPRWKLFGMTPSMALRHNRVRSNIDWLYTYRKNAISLKMEREF
jgi:hypothetical protein